MRYWAQRNSRIWQPAYLGNVVAESWADEGVTQHTVPRGQGTTPPVLTYSGAGLVGGRVVPYIQCDGAGALGVWTYKVSYDDGATFPHTGVLSSGSATPLPGVGSAISVAAAAGNAATNNIWESLAAKVNDRNGTNHATQAEAANMPIVRAKGFNGRPALDWGSSGSAGKKLDLPSISLGAFSLFLVLRGDASSGHPLVHNVDAGANGMYMYGTHPCDRIERGGVVTAKDASPWLQDGVRKTACITYNGTHASNLFYVNGAAVSTLDVATGDPGTAAAVGAVYIGAQQAGISPFRGVFAGWIIANRAFSASEVAALHRYAAVRFPL